MDSFKVPNLPTVTPVVKAETGSTALKATASPTAVPEDVKPAPQSSTAQPASSATCPYKVPPWSATPHADANYKFEVLKSGQIIEEVASLQKQAIWKFGRLPKPANDLELAHPTISRFHAVLQYRPQPQVSDNSSSDQVTQEPPAGWYIYDLDSTHGTFLNKQRVPPRVYIRMRVGHMLRLGASTRSYILQGPCEDEEPESELSVSELRAQHQQQVAEAAAEAKRQAEEAEERKRNEGISWGMAEDADEETDLAHNPYATTNNEELFLDDPKRTLRGYFEREGLQLEYKCDEMSAGSFVCRVELPLDDAFGRPIIAEVVHKGRKKECVVQCALEACRILDRHGVLRQANQEPLKRKVKSQSDSDDDDFLDRTGDIERKKMRKANTGQSVALTYDELLKQEAELGKQLQQIEVEIGKYHEARKQLKDATSQGETNIDDLDSFMENLKDDAPHLDKTEIRRLRLEQQRIKAEQQRLQRLIKIAKPVELPFMRDATDAAVSTSSTTKKQLPLIGKRNQFSKFKVAKMVEKSAVSTVGVNCAAALASDEEEIEDDVDRVPQHKETQESNEESEIPATSENSTVHTDLPASESKSSEPPKPTAIRKVYGPAAVPSKISDVKPQPDSVRVPSENTDKDAIANEKSTPLNDEQVESEQRKRRQRRQRLRYKRQEVDIEELEEHESSEKYAKWVPPENQSGDGYTKLNEKYGY